MIFGVRFLHRSRWNLATPIASGTAETEHESAHARLSGHENPRCRAAWAVLTARKGYAPSSSHDAPSVGTENPTTEAGTSTPQSSVRRISWSYLRSGGPP